MQDVRCPNCGRLLCKMEPSTERVELKCPRCGRLVVTLIKIVPVLAMARHGGQDEQVSESL